MVFNVLIVGLTVLAFTPTLTPREKNDYYTRILLWSVSCTWPVRRLLTRARACMAVVLVPLSCLRLVFYACACFYKNSNNNHNTNNKNQQQPPPTMATTTKTTANNTNKQQPPHPKQPQQQQNINNHQPPTYVNEQKMTMDWAINEFTMADEEDRAGLADQSTARKFYSGT